MKKNQTGERAYAKLAGAAALSNDGGGTGEAARRMMEKGKKLNLTRHTVNCQYSTVETFRTARRQEERCLFRGIIGLKERSSVKR